jgi:hypothetical protein
MTVSTPAAPAPYRGTLEIRFRTETWQDILLFDQITITRAEPDTWTIEGSQEETVKLTDRDRQVLGTYAMPFALTVRALPGAPLPQPWWAPEL